MEHQRNCWSTAVIKEGDVECMYESNWYVAHTNWTAALFNPAASHACSKTLSASRFEPGAFDMTVYRLSAEMNMRLKLFAESIHNASGYCANFPRATSMRPV